MAYNEAHGIVPTTIQKEIRDGIGISTTDDDENRGHRMSKRKRKSSSSG